MHGQLVITEALHYNTQRVIGNKFLVQCLAARQPSVVCLEQPSTQTRCVLKQ